MQDFLRKLVGQVRVSGEKHRDRECGDRQRQPEPVIAHRAGCQQPAADRQLGRATARHRQAERRLGAPGQPARGLRRRGRPARRHRRLPGGLHHGRDQRQLQEDRRHHRRDRRHRLPDQPPRAQRRGRGRARR